jgi:hypothetical protein
VASLITNGLLGGWLILSAATDPPDRVGVLLRPLQVHPVTKPDEVLFALPQGLTVRDATPRLPWFTEKVYEPYRFTITVTAWSTDAINYAAPQSAINWGGHFYSVARHGDGGQPYRGAGYKQRTAYPSLIGFFGIGSSKPTPQWGH